jgi:hypothetical protein
MDQALSSSRYETLQDLLTRRASQKTIEAHLDALLPRERLDAVLAVTGAQVGKLYDAVLGSRPLTLEDFVPPGETGTIIFEGRNSLPAFSRFQKRFARSKDLVFGYNHQTMSFVTGPGYFRVQPPTRGETHPDELFFDYTSDPPLQPAGWPPIKRNDAGLSRAVYMDMKDFCRRVAKGVLVGKAYKRGVSQNAYFTLTNVDA